MNRRKFFYSLLVLVLLGVSVGIAGSGVRPQYKPTERAAYLSEALETVLQPGLNITIQKVDLSAANPAVTFRISDANNQGLDRNGVLTPGPVSFGFVLARIRPGDTQYTSYVTSVRTNTPTGAPLTDPNADSTGTFADLGDGTYKYTFANQVTNVDQNSTTTLGMYARRDLSAFGYPLNTIGTIVNAFSTFVPSGAPVTQVRDVVSTAACNQCHDPLALHGGRRQDTRLCILCHQPQNTDPPTLNSLDFKVFIHKIHMGANLPSVHGQPLNINMVSGYSVEKPAEIGNGATPGVVEEGTPVVKRYMLGSGDYSSVVWPQDVRNCTTCHNGGTQSDNWKTNPNRAACGACHDDVDFTTGKNHAGGPQANDSQCAICHVADSGNEFDASVAGAHTMPWKSKQLAGLNLKITGVTNANPGSKPTVTFTASDNKGNPVDATKLTSLGFLMAGPTTDYTFVTRSALTAGETIGSPGTENALPTVKASGTGFTYTFSTALPADAKGTFAVGVGASRSVTIPGSLLGPSLTVTENVATNPVFYFGVGGATATPRRKVVDVANCNVCHKNIAAHGGGRLNATEYCQMCHNPASTDQPDGSRAAGFPVPAGTAATSINFRFMIHRIHRGEELERPFDVFRTRGVFGFNGLRFPGDLRDCAKCHVNKSNQLPLPTGLAGTAAPREFYTPLGPAASACLGCHDGVDAAAHAYLQTAPFGESCPVCHEEGADFAVSKVHAR